MMNRHSQRGEGRLGFIISVTVLAVIAFVGFKIVPVRINAYNFRDTIREECRMGAVRNSDKVIKQRIMDAAEELDIPLSNKNLSVRRTKSKMIITATFEQPIDLKVTTYTYKFNAKEEAPLF